MPLSSLKAVPKQEQQEETIEYEKVTPATSELNANIRQQLDSYFPRSAPLSLLLLHVSQLEHIHITPQSAILHKRQRYHASASLLEQVLVNIRRAIRGNDKILIHAGAGAAVIFPGVDQQGVHSILERAYRNVSLLQAETVIPPLKRETDIVMGVSSYPEAGPSIEHLLYHVSVTARRFILRPAITTQLWNAVPTHIAIEETIALHPQQDQQDPTGHTDKTYGNVPFMQLPTKLPMRLKQLIPYHIALELSCAPVGRDHHCLTVALANPTNYNVIQFLGEMTGLTIYPVSCEIAALNALLANKW
jgi:hypothetical protein